MVAVGYIARVVERAIDLLDIGESTSQERIVGSSRSGLCDDSETVICPYSGRPLSGERVLGWLVNISACVGIVFMSAALAAYFAARLHTVMRIPLGVGGLLLLIPGFTTDIP